MNLATTDGPVFVRGGYGVFAFVRGDGDGGSFFTSRAVAVCGAGL